MDEEPHSAASPSEQVHVLERRTPHLQPLELVPGGERFDVSSCRTRVGSVVRRTTSLPFRRKRISVSPPAPSIGQLRRRALTHDRAVPEDTRPGGQVLGLVEVVRRQEDRLPERPSERSSPRRPVAPGVEGRSSARRGRRAPGYRTSATPRSSRRFCPRERLHARVRLSASPTSRSLVHVPGDARSSRRRHGASPRPSRFGKSWDCWRTTPIRCGLGLGARRIEAEDSDLPPSRRRYPSRISTWSSARRRSDRGGRRPRPR